MNPDAFNQQRRRWCWWGMVAVAAGYYGCFFAWPRRFFAVGVNHLGVWFLDAYAILASNEALALGLDPYAPNPLDPLTRPHVYSHWWLGANGLARADTRWVGLALVVAFLVVAVARLRPREPREAAWYLLVLCSSPLLLAVERANNDLVVFLLLTPVVPCLLDGRRLVRMAALVPIALATGLKFYPAVAGLALLAVVDRRELRDRLILAGLAFALVGASVAEDLGRFGSIAPKAEGLMTFGAVNLLESAGVHGRVAQALALALGTLPIIFSLRSAIFSRWEIAAADRADWLGFVLGAALLTGCFFLGTNYAYRWIFALWMAPLLWRLPRDQNAPPAVRRFAALTAALLVFALWFDALASGALNLFVGRVTSDTMMRWADRIFAVEQPVTWAFFACLLGWIAHFARGGVRALLGR